MERIVRFNHTTLEFSVACYERTNNSTVSTGLIRSVVVDSPIDDTGWVIVFFRRRPTPDKCLYWLQHNFALPAKLYRFKKRDFKDICLRYSY